MAISTKYKQYSQRSQKGALANPKGPFTGFGDCTLAFGDCKVKIKTRSDYFNVFQVYTNYFWSYLFHCISWGETTNGLLAIICISQYKTNIIKFIHDFVFSIGTSFWVSISHIHPFYFVFWAIFEVKLHENRSDI